MLCRHLQGAVATFGNRPARGRLAQNFDVFDFEPTDDELARIDALDKGVRGGPESEEVTPEPDTRQIPEP